MTGAGAPPQDFLVSTSWLEANLGSPTLRVVDVRGQVLPPGNVPRYRAKREAYAASHIPGSRFVDWTTDIVDGDDAVPMQVARPEAFARTMGALDVGEDSFVVAYDDYHQIFAGRLTWALRYYGHAAAAVLDGGWAKWLSDGRPVTREVPSIGHARFTPRIQSRLRRTAGEVAAALGRPDTLLIDARAPEQYEGRASVAHRGGHIPGARNVHYTRLVNPSTGCLLPKDELAKAFADGGVDVTRLPAQIVVYCNSGVSCTLPMNALRMLGRDDVAVYDGSWNEWGNDDRLPVTAGREP